MRAGSQLSWLVWFGAVLVALTAFGLLLDIPASAGTNHSLRVKVLVGLLGLSTAVYFGAVRLVLRYTWPRGTFWLALGVARALRVVLLTAPPILSSDIYRYVWHGRVQAAAINPYRYIPADPALAGLRDATVYPRINRADYARTIYPPVAQMVFAVVGRLGGSHEHAPGNARLRGAGYRIPAAAAVPGRTAARAHPHLRLEPARLVVFCD
jgi:alpha-1,6-mannosyltransferase